MSTPVPNVASRPDQAVAAPLSVAAPIGHLRWTICALLFAATTINYMDRQVFGLLAPDL